MLARLERATHGYLSGTRSASVPAMSEAELQRAVIALARLLGYRVPHWRSGRIEAELRGETRHEPEAA